MIVASCQQSGVVPFPENPSEYQEPIVNLFEVPKGKPLTWNKIPNEKVPKAVIHAIDFSQLPSKPFDILDFKRLKSPPLASPIAWTHEEELKLNLDTIQGISIPVKTAITRTPDYQTGISIQIRPIECRHIENRSDRGFDWK